MNQTDVIKLLDSQCIHLENQFIKNFEFFVVKQGADKFKAKVNIEVQWASEPVIAAIERNGGVITTAYYDIDSLWILRMPHKFFQRGKLVEIIDNEIQF